MNRAKLLKKLNTTVDKINKLNTADINLVVEKSLAGNAKLAELEEQLMKRFPSGPISSPETYGNMDFDDLCTELDIQMMALKNAHGYHDALKTGIDKLLTSAPTVDVDTSTVTKTYTGTLSLSSSKSRNTATL